MFKIRIKKQPQKGDQADYSLYNRTGYAPDTKGTTPVGDTLGPVPREEATLEAEGGETVVGDINQDGYLEHFKFRGKRHSEGGVPANIPAGSFIYSDTKKMRIKDKEILKNFGLASFKNGGVTPATLAKQYDINKYMAVLRDENSDPIAKRTAQFMLDNNLKKLAELALVQESMKGFPDGIPAIAESVMGPLDPDMGQAPQQMQQARYGGLAKYQNAGQTNTKQKQSTEADIRKRYANNKISIKNLTKDENGNITVVDQYNAIRKYYNNGRVVDFRRNGRLASKADDAGDGNIRNRVDELKYNPNASMMEKLKFEYDAESVSKDKNGNYTVIWIDDETNNKYKGVISANGETLLPFSIQPAKKSDVKASTQPSVPTGMSVEAAKKLFDQAYKSGNVNVMRRAAAQIENFKEDTGPFSWGWVPGSNENNFDSMVTMLNNQAKQLQTLTIPQTNQRNALNSTVKRLIPQYEAEYKKALSGQPYNIPEDKIKAVKQLFEYKKELDQYRDFKQNPPEQYVGYNLGTKYPTLFNLGVNGYQERLNTLALLDDSATPLTGDPLQTISTDLEPAKKNKIDTPVIKSVVKQDTIRANSFAEAAKMFEAGGQFQFEVGGQSELIEYAVGVETTTDPPKGKVIEKDGKFYYGTVENGMKIIRDAAGKVVYTEKATAVPGNNKPIKSINDLPEAAQKYAKWDPAAKRFRIELPDAATYEERNAVSKALTEAGFKDVRQSANSRIKGSNASGYNNFYAGLTPQDFERKFVEAQVGKDASDKMDEVTRRKEYFKLLGVTNVTDEQLKDPKKLYNDKTFMTDFYQKFQAKLPKDEFRPVMGNDASFGLEHFDAIRPYEKEKTNEIQPKTEGKKETTVVEDKSFDTTPTKETGWWLPDIANFAAALTDKVSDYPPSLQQVKLDNPDYVLLDPSRQVASIKEQEARQQELINNTASGQVARANMLGVAGESGARSADILANYENQNAQIVNNAYAQAANTNNQEAMMNQQLQDQFMVRSATYGQQKDNSERQLKQRKLNAFLQGTVNNFRKKQTEQVLFPQVYIDPITGDASFSGKGKDMDAPDGFYTGTGANTSYAPDMYAGQEAAILKVYMDKGYSREEALQSARSVLGKTIPTGDARNRLAMQNLNNPFAGYSNVPAFDPND